MSFLQPTLYLAAMGLGLGSLVDRGGAVLPGDVSYLAFSRQGCWPAPACRPPASSPASRSCGKMRGSGTTKRSSASTHANRRHRCRRARVGGASTDGGGSRLHGGDVAVRRRTNAVGCRRRSCGGAHGAGVQCADHGVCRHLEQDRQLQRHFPFRHYAAVSLLRRVLPIARCRNRFPRSPCSRRCFTAWSSHAGWRCKRWRGRKRRCTARTRRDTAAGTAVAVWAFARKLKGVT